MGYCVHFNGLSHRACRANRPYYSVRDASGWEWRYPCIQEDKARTSCRLCHYPNEAEAQARLERRAPARRVVAAGGIRSIEDLFEPEVGEG